MRAMTSPLHPRALLAAAAVGILGLSACSSGGGNAFTPGATGAASGGGAAIVVGAQDFTEANIMQSMYVLLLQNAGFTVTTKKAQRPVLFDALKSGQVDVVPDYLGTTITFLGNQVNGTKDSIYSSNDTAKEVADFKAIGAKAGIGAFTPAAAQNQNSFYVTKKFAASNGNLTTLSQLAALKKPLKLGADTFCGASSQPYCINGLKKVYGLNQLTLDDSYTFGTVKLAQAVLDGTVDVGETGTTDATLEPKGLVALKDDKMLQSAENLTPFYNLKKVTDPKVAATLNKLAAVLTLEDLSTLNGKVDNDRQKAEDVAKAYLQSKKLIP